MGRLNQGFGSSILRFLKITIVGGLVFLLPMVILVIILGQAMRLAKKVAQPVSALLPGAEHSVVAVFALAVLTLVVVSLVAGLVARTIVGRRIRHWIENSYLSNIPQYQMMKSMAEGLTRIENAQGVNPVLINIEDAWQIGYLIEPLENGWVTVFLPQAPTPMSGNVMYMPADRVHPLSITMVQAMGIVKHLGVGSREALRRADLELPAST